MAIYKEVLEITAAVAGSPNISSNGLAGKLTSSNYFTTTLPNIATPFTFISKLYLPDTVLYYGTDPASFSIGTASRYFGFKAVSSGFTPALYLGATSTTVSAPTFKNAWVWIKLESRSNRTELYYLEDPTGNTYDYLSAFNSSDWVRSLHTTRGYSYLTASDLYIGKNRYRNSHANWEIDLTNTGYSLNGGETEWMAAALKQVDVSGSVELAPGYCKVGSERIISQGTTKYSIDALTAGQTTSGKNNLFIYKDTSDNVGALLSSTTPAGSFKATKDLSHPVYLSNLKNYIVGDTLFTPAVSYHGGAKGTLSCIKVGSVSISDDFRAGGFSDSSYLLIPNSYNTFKPAGNFAFHTAFSLNTITSNEVALLDSGQDGSYSIRLTLASGKVKLRVSAGGSTTYAVDVTSTNVLSVATKYYLRLMYIPTTGYTVSVKTDDTDWEDWIISSTITTWFHSHTTEYRLGDNTADGTNSLDGIIYLEDTGVNQADEEDNWAAVDRGPVVFKAEKALQYSEESGKTFWVSEEASVGLDEVKASQSVGASNNLYLTNTADSDVSSLSLSNTGVVSGVESKYALKQKVYLTEDLTDVLGVQERPNEITIERSGQLEVAVTGWSNYGPIKTVSLMPGVSFESVAVTPTTLSSLQDLTQGYTITVKDSHPIFYKQTDSYTGLGIYGSYQATLSSYTGYRLIFTDSTNTAISSVVKTGTRCRMYCAKTGSDTSTFGQELTYYVITPEQYEEGITEGVQAKKESIINQNLGLIPLEFTGTATVGVDVTYDPIADTFSDGEHTAIFVGEYFADI